MCLRVTLSVSATASIVSNGAVAPVAGGSVDSFTMSMLAPLIAGEECVPIYLWAVSGPKFDNILVGAVRES